MRDVDDEGISEPYDVEVSGIPLGRMGLDEVPMEVDGLKDFWWVSKVDIRIDW